MQERRRAVADLAGRRGGDGPLRGQHLERRHLLHAGVRAGALVVLHALQGGDLLGEVAGADGGQRPLVALVGELLQLQAGQLPLAHHHLGADELADGLLAVALPPAFGPAPGVGQPQGHARHEGRPDGDHGHVLHAAGDDQVLGAAHHGLGGEVHRLLRGPALAIDGDARNVLRQATGEPRRPRDAARLRADGVQAAHHDVLDGARVHRRALHQGRERVGAQVRGVHLGQPALAPAHGAPNRSDDVCLAHGFSPCVCRVLFKMASPMRRRCHVMSPKARLMAHVRSNHRCRRCSVV